MSTRIDEQRTDWDDELTRMVESSFGDVSYGEWCKKESSRMNDSGGNVEVRQRRHEGIKQCSIYNRRG